VPTAIDPQLRTVKDWTFRLHLPKAHPKRLLVLLHGWLGDENSMWLLARNLSPEIAILSPRGIFSAPQGGYSWRAAKPGTWSMATLEDFRLSADALIAFVEDWAATAGVDALQFDLMGFSQGAALTYILTLLYPQRIRRLAALSGFIPAGGPALITRQSVSGKPVFMSHGRKDDVIPVEQSRQAAARFQQAGALVKYCESDTAHKVSKECLKETEGFFGTY
jgi:phospholipase/carboxylesterase